MSLAMTTGLTTSTIAFYSPKLQPSRKRTKNLLLLVRHLTDQASPRNQEAACVGQITLLSCLCKCLQQKTNAMASKKVTPLYEGPLPTTLASHFTSELQNFWVKGRNLNFTPSGMIFPVTLVSLQRNFQPHYLKRCLLPIKCAVYIHKSWLPHLILNTDKTVFLLKICHDI